MDSMLYTVGGYDGSRALISGEMFNPETGEWTEMINLGLATHTR